MASNNDDLIGAYKKALNKINEDKINKNLYINEYIDLVLILNKIPNNLIPNNNNPNNPNNNNNNPNNNELYKMLKNPLEISIYNNFQRYNDKPNNPIINPANTTNDKQNEENELRAAQKTLNPELYNNITLKKQ